MANKRISELTTITGANLADADLLVVVDVSDTTMASSGTNKKITMAELAKDSALTDNLIAKTTLTTDGDVLTRAAGAPARITRADLAQDSAFSSRYASSTAFPSGAFTAWTPTVTSQTGTITTVGATAGRYVQFGKLVTCHFTVTITTKGTAGGVLYLTLPVTARTNTVNDFLSGANGTYREIANTGVIGVVIYSSTTLVALKKYDNGTPFGADGDQFVGTFTYEAA